MRKLSTILILSMFTCIFITGCGKGKDIINEKTANKIMTIEHSNYGISEIYKDKLSNKAYEIKDSNVVNEYICNIDVDVGKPIMELSKTDEASDLLYNVEKLGDYIYYIDLETSTKYVNYLKNQSYTLKFKVCTSDYIEMYFTSELGNKRLIITDSTLILGNVDSDYELNINNYLQ